MKNDNKKQKALPLTLSIIALVIIMMIIMITYAYNLFLVKPSATSGGLNAGTSGKGELKDSDDYNTPFERHLRPGDTIEFAGISWEVLDQDGNTFLMITKNCLEYLPWDDGTSGNGSTAVSRAGRSYYEFSSIRKYLNEKVVPKLFTKDDLKYITPVAVKHDTSAIRPNNEYATDYAFLLNEKMVQYYADKLSVNESFWLGERSYKESTEAMCFTSSGLSRTDAGTSLGLRPAIYVTIDNPPLFMDKKFLEFINTVMYDYYSIPCYVDGGSQYGFIQFREDCIHMQGAFVCNFVDGEPQGLLDTDMSNGDYYYSNFDLSKDADGNYTLTDMTDGVKFVYTESDKTWHYYNRNYNGYKEYGIEFGEFVELVPYVYSQKNDLIDASIAGIETEAKEKEAQEEEMAENVGDDDFKLIVKEGYRLKSRDYAVNYENDYDFMKDVYEYDSDGYLCGIEETWNPREGESEVTHYTVTHEGGYAYIDLNGSTTKTVGKGFLGYIVRTVPIFEDQSGTVWTDELNSMTYDKYGYEVKDNDSYEYLDFDEHQKPTEIKRTINDGSRVIYYDVENQYDEDGVLYSIKRVIRDDDITEWVKFEFEKIP